MEEVSEAREGLRERKKQQTHDRIAQVALELFDRHGFQATTIAEIADASGVSPRTVSAYFPAKEDLVFPGSAEMFDRLEQRLAARAPDETTADALRDWIATEAVDWQRRSEQMRTQRRVIEADDLLPAHELRFIVRAEQLIAAAIAKDLGGSPGDLEPRMASAATMAIFAVLGSARDDEDGGCIQRGTAADPDPVALLDRALLFVNAGIRALQGERPVTAAAAGAAAPALSV